MNRFIFRRCPYCHEYQRIKFIRQNELVCPHCKDIWGKIDNPQDLFDRCPICGCRQFYLAKGFNQFLGCFIMLIAVVLVPSTYGLSLPIFALIDWFLWRRVPTVINCYRCGTEYQNFKTARQFKPFMHHIGLKYDKYR